MNKQPQHATWSSRWTFILAATGSAVGLGNIWKFPYITGENGGGAFVLVYLACIALIGIPVMIGETLLGRMGRTDPVHTMASLSAKIDVHKGWVLLGAMGVLAGLMILMFYSVVAGWSLEYIFQSFASSYQHSSAEQIDAAFNQLTDDTNRQLLWHSLFLALTTLIVAFGVSRGIGNAITFMMPMLFILAFVLLWYSWQNGDFAAGLAFLFSPDFSQLSGKSVLIAMGHAFFTISLGMGAIMVYGSYMPQSASIPKTVVTIAFLDTLIALVAGLIIFPIVFANGLEAGSGPGLLFKSLPVAFSQMWNGMLFGGIFFLLIAIAALSSAISLIEPGIAWLEKLGVKRIYAALGLALLCWLGGLASIYSGEVFNFLDAATSRYMLPLGGLLIAIFVGWKLGYTKVRKEINDINTGLFNLWFVVLRFLAPAGVIIVFAYSLGLFDSALT